MARTKKTSITIDQADDLEQRIGDYLSESGDNEDLLEFLWTLLDKKTAASLMLRIDDVGSNICALRDEVLRYTAEDVVRGLQSLDTWLGQTFKVTGMPERRRGRVHEYKWEVWG